MGARDGCAQGEGLTAQLPHGSDSSLVRAAWTFAAPSDTAIIGFEVHRIVRGVDSVPSGLAGYLSSFGAWPPPVADSDEACLYGNGMSCERLRRSANEWNA